ncbi:hypothetical protein [Halococcus sp. PRR34]|uniref:hypothetical protein n=1 Tax=Halococcus sp. PRR34 TaxID=3020830 RepID=UPI00235F1CD4|nr:hypothetical protein [Halococcus sp. PRR34]
MGWLTNRSRRVLDSINPRSVYACYFVPWLALTARHRIGKDIFDEEWDLVVILDACRVDALREVANEYDFLDDVHAELSMGSSSKEWMVNTFHETNKEKINDTVYVTANAWAEQVLDDTVSFTGWTVTNGTFVEGNQLVERLAYRPTVTKADFRDVIEQPLSNVGGIDGFPAEQLTDFAIEAGRKYNDSRMIVHYMQPHAPFLHHVANGEQPDNIDEKPLEALNDIQDRKIVREGYVDNLRYVLDNIEILLENFDGNVLITADHGEMLGKRLHGHGEGIPHPKLRWVPWVRTTATDSKTRDPDVEISEGVSEDIDTRLSALGYI